MTSSSIRCPVVHRSGEDNCKTMSQKCEYDENGNITLKSHYNKDSNAKNLNSDYKYSKNDPISIIFGQIERMYEYFPNECLVYIQKLVPSQNLTSEAYDHIGIFVNVFIRCIKCCLENTNCDLNILCKLRESIISMLTFLSDFKDSNVYDKEENNLYGYKVCVIFGYLFDVELLLSCYQDEKSETIKNRLIKFMDCYLETGDDQSIAILYSKEFLSTNICQNYEDIRVPILEKLFKTNSSGTLKILVFKLWKNFLKDTQKENVFIEDIFSKKICPEDLTGLGEVLSVVPEQLENNLAEFLRNSEFDIMRAIEVFIKTKETLLEVDYSVPEVDFVDTSSITEKGGQNYLTEDMPTVLVKPSSEAILKLPFIEHDYCRSTLDREELASVSLESLPSQNETPEDRSDEYLTTDESVEVELCDLCVELGTLAIDSSDYEVLSCSPKTLNKSEDELGSSKTESVNESLSYSTDPVYQLHCDTCEADGKCFAQQYDYIIFCKRNVDLVPTELPEVTFSEESRCQCLSCHNNYECLLKNWRMLKEYARERTEKINELAATKAELIENNEVPDRNYQCLSHKVPPEYKRSASETLKHKLPLKKRKFSFDDA